MTTNTNSDIGSASQTLGGIVSNIIGTTNQITATTTDSGVTLSSPPMSWQYVKISPSASVINNMYTSPILAVPAAGANTLLIMYKFGVDHKHDGVAYSSGGNTSIQYDSTANNGGVITSTVIATASFSGTTDIFTMVGAISLSATASSTTVNKGLYISNATGNFTTGTDTVNFHIWYSIISTSI